MIKIQNKGQKSNRFYVSEGMNNKMKGTKWYRNDYIQINKEKANKSDKKYFNYIMYINKTIEVRKK